MKTDDENRDKKLQYHIDKEVAKISALSSGTIDKYDILVNIYCILIKDK